MNASKFFLKAANSLVTAIVALFLILAAAYSGYALWDNAQVYGAVDDIQSQLLKLKPDPEQKDGGASFEELRKINPDVCGWITLDHTKIDYPILQGEDNLTYINTDVYGDFAVSASKEGVVHNRSFFVILTTDSFEALFISYFKPAGIR